MTAEQTHWLAEDLTTPANHRGREPSQSPPDQGRHGGRTGRADAGVFLAGVWLVIASVAVAYRFTGRFDVLWNDAVVGIAVAVVTLVRLVRPAGVQRGVTCALGVWVGVAPFVLGYGGGAADAGALANDVAVGVAIVALTLAGAATGKPAPSAEPAEPGSPTFVVGP